MCEIIYQGYFETEESKNKVTLLQKELNESQEMEAFCPYCCSPRKTAEESPEQVKIHRLSKNYWRCSRCGKDLVGIIKVFIPFLTMAAQNPWIEFTPYWAVAKIKGEDAEHLYAEEVGYDKGTIGASQYPSKFPRTIKEIKK